MTKLKRFIKKELDVYSVMTLSIFLPVYIMAPIFAVCLFRILRREKANIKTILKEAAGWVSFCIFSFIVSIYFRNWQGAAYSLLYFIYVIYFKFYYRNLSDKAYHKQLNLITVGSVFSSLVAIIDYIIFIINENVPFTYILTETSLKYRADSTFINANYFGLMCVFSCLVCVYLFNKYKDKKLRVYYVTTFLLNIIGLVLTASRMVWVALFVGLICLVAIIKPKLLFIIFAGGILAVILLIVKPDLLPRFSDLAAGFSDRFKLWDTGWQIFKLSPLTGRGQNNFAMYYHLFDAKALVHCHQLFIELLSSYGIIGVFLLVVSTASYYRRLFRKENIQIDRYNFAFIVSVMVAVLVHGLMDVAIISYQVGFIYLLLIYSPKFMKKNQKSTC